MRYIFFAVALIVTTLSLWNTIQYKKYPNTHALITAHPTHAPNYASIQANQMTGREFAELTQKILPRDPPQMDPSACLHILRVHGINADFPDHKLNSGKSILKLLTDEETGKIAWGQPAMLHVRSGVRYPSKPTYWPNKSFPFETHRDQCLAGFAELGLPLAFPIRVDGCDFTIADVLNDSIVSFQITQDELAWTAIAYSLYLPPNPKWTNRFGKEFTFDILCESLLKTNLAKCSCGGLHIASALAILYQANEEHGILTTENAKSLRDHLSSLVVRAISSQDANGSWGLNWYLNSNHEKPPTSMQAATYSTSLDRILATGHITEWLLLLPADLRPKTHVFQRAAEWLTRELRSLSVTDNKTLCPASHAISSLRKITSIRNDEPYKPSHKISSR